MEIGTIDLQFQGRPEAIAVFFIDLGERYVLFESGPFSTWETLEMGLAAQGYLPRDCAGLFLTHVHLDHAGAMGDFAMRGVQIFAHTKAIRHLADPSRLVDSARQVYGAEPFERLWGEMLGAPQKCLTALADGEAVELGPLLVEAMETFGHTYHHHAYWIGDTCFAGDALGARLPGSRWISVTSAPTQFDYAETLATIERIEQREPERLFLTHFGEVQDPAQHLLRYRAAVEVAWEWVCEQLAAGADEQEIAQHYREWSRARARQMDVSDSQWETMEAINGAEMCAFGMLQHAAKLL